MPPRSLCNLSITITERCNLACRYCYMPRDSAHTMRAEIVDAAIDFFVEHANRDAKIWGISFFGGEPLLAPHLIRRAADRARAIAPQNIVFSTPTNGLLLAGETLDLVHEIPLDLAVSLDTGDRSDRVFRDGTPAEPTVMRRLAVLQAGASPSPRIRLTKARVTLTPAHVGDLATAVRRLIRAGFREVIIVVALDMPWTDEHLAIYRTELAKLATLCIGNPAVLHALPTFAAIVGRLRAHAPKPMCGAGVSRLAVSVGGAIVPCFRLSASHVVHRDQGRAAPILGHVTTGFSGDAGADFARFDPERLAPEIGPCSQCPARDGCTISCPAAGWAHNGDVHGVPAIACRLQQAEVAAMRVLATR
jgi:uncharacterized protein